MSTEADREQQPLADTGRSAALVATGIFLSRTMGLVREIAMAAFLATGVAADAFRAAIRIPNLLQNLLGEGVLSAAFIPVYSRLLHEGDEEEAGRVAGAVAGLLAVVTGALVLVAVLFAEPITTVLAPGFTGAAHDLTVTLVRIMTAGIGFLVLSAWCLGILNSHRRFFLSYVAPVVWNGAQIAVLVTVGLWGWSEASIAEALAWGVFVGGILQFLVQLPTVLRVGRRIRFSVRTDLPGVRTVSRRFGPALLGRGVVQIGAYVDLALASLLALGAVAALGYAQILYLLPISLFAMSVAAAELPEMSRTDEDSAQGERLASGARRITFFMTFTVFAYLTVGKLIVAALYERRAFDADDTKLVWLIIAAYSLGLLAIGNSRLLQNALYARGDVAGPAVIAAVRVAVAAGIGVVLMFQLEQFVIIGGELHRAGDLPVALEPLPAAVRQDPDLPLRAGAMGLAIGSAIASWLELLLLRARLSRAGIRTALAAPFFRLMPAAAASVVCMVGLRYALESLPALAAAPIAVGVGGAVYIGVARAAGVAEASAVIAPVERRLRR